MIRITGYTQDGECTHCHRQLKHVIQTDQGPLGAQCVVKMVKPNKKRWQKLTPCIIILLAKWAGAMPDQQARQGYMPEHFELETILDYFA